MNLRSTTFPLAAALLVAGGLLVSGVFDAAPLPTDVGEAAPVREAPRTVTHETGHLVATGASAATERADVRRAAVEAQESSAVALSSATDPADEGLTDELVDLRGVLWDARGMPIEGGTVSVNAPFGTTRTDDEGEYDLRLRRDVDHIDVVATHPEHGLRRVEYEMSTDYIDCYLDITFHAGARAELLVVDTEGEPVAGAEVRLWKQDAELTPGVVIGSGERRAQLWQHRLLGGTDVRIAFSDEHGAATLGGLAPGAYQLSVECTGFMPFQRRDALVRELALAELGEVVLDRGNAVSGWVRDCAGQPLADVPVKGFFDFAYYEVRTDTSGRFTLGGIPRTVAAGELLVQSPSGGTFWDPQVAVGAAELVLDLCPGALQLDVRDSVSDARVSGPATVELDGIESGGVLFGTGFEPVRTVTLEAGVARLSEVPSNTVAITLRCDGHYPTRRLLTADERLGPVRVELESSPGLELDLAALGASSGAPVHVELTERSEDGFRQRKVTARSIAGAVFHVDAKHFPLDAPVTVAAGSTRRVVYEKAAGERLPAEKVRVGSD
ncbi:MAG: hypothetical protein GY711_10150 [bacterium]|nr:hypothetical protein [bacterium]